jgi:uncharacterized protein DUF4126
MPDLELILSICLGVGLSAACGFRVFVPLLGISAAALAGQVHLASEFEWVGTWPALACFLTATILEVAAYYVPWIDNALDSIATPAAVVAGTLATASVITDLSPLSKWTLAVIAGGGVAGLIQTGTVALRGASTATTGGLANFLVATAELIASVCTTILAIVLPVLALGLVLLVGGVILYRSNRRATTVLPAKSAA